MVLIGSKGFRFDRFDRFLWEPEFVCQKVLELCEECHRFRAALQNGLGKTLGVGRVALAHFRERHDDGKGVVDPMLQLTELLMDLVEFRVGH